MVTPLNTASELMKEAREENKKDTLKEYKQQVKALLKKETAAKKLLRNIQNEIIDLEIRITKELE